MESVWDYIMRRKPVFLGYFALFLVSVFASCQLLNSILPRKTTTEPNTVQETPQHEQYDRILSPEIVASLPAPENSWNSENLWSSETPASPIPDSLAFVQVDISNPVDSSEAVAVNPETAEPILTQVSEPVDIPLTSAPQSTAETTAANPRKVSIFRTVLAVLLAVAALTLAGFGLYQAYDYLAPFIDDYLQRNCH